MTIKQAYQTAEDMQHRLGSGTPYVRAFSDGVRACVELATDITVDYSDERTPAYIMIVEDVGFAGVALEEAVQKAVDSLRAKAEDHRCESFRLDKISAVIKAAACNLPLCSQQ